MYFNVNLEAVCTFARKKRFSGVSDYILSYCQFERITYLLSPYRCRDICYISYYPDRILKFPFRGDETQHATSLQQGDKLYILAAICWDKSYILSFTISFSNSITLSFSFSIRSYKAFFSLYSSITLSIGLNVGLLNIEPALSYKVLETILIDAALSSSVMASTGMFKATAILSKISCSSVSFFS